MLMLKSDAQNMFITIVDLLLTTSTTFIYRQMQKNILPVHS